MRREPPITVGPVGDELNRRIPAFLRVIKATLQADVDSLPAYRMHRLRLAAAERILTHAPDRHAVTRGLAALAPLASAILDQHRRGMRDRRLQERGRREGTRRALAAGPAGVAVRRGGGWTETPGARGECQ